MGKNNSESEASVNLIAVIGSPRKGEATDTLVDKAIEGVLMNSSDKAVKLGQKLGRKNKK